MKRLFMSVSVLVLLVAPQFTFAADVDDLKAAEAQLIKALNSLDAAAFASMIHPGSVNYGRDSAFAELAPMENPEATIRTGLQGWFSTVESINITPVNYQYRVVGNTGIVWGHDTASIKPKDGPMKAVQSRMTDTWIKSGGKWLLLMSHNSAIPSGD